MPTAVITIGTTIGEISRAITVARPGKFGRLRPSAARVPRAVASTVVATATMTLFRSAACQRSEVKNRSEEHTSELQSLMRNSYAVFCLKIKKYTNSTQNIEILIPQLLANTILNDTAN